MSNLDRHLAHDLDNYITGHYGEDQFKGMEDVEDEPTRTRLWMNEEGNTCVQFRTDTEIPVWMHTNLGWINVGNAPTDHEAAEQFAVELAEGYSLTEMSAEIAQRYLGD